jgi:hypothetical protein
LRKCNCKKVVAGFERKIKGESGALVNKLDLFLFAVENIEHKSEY